MKAALLAMMSNPMSYVLAFALCGVLCIVAGVGLLLGTGAALVCLGMFLLSAAGYVTKGMKPHG